VAPGRDRRLGAGPDLSLVARDVRTGIERWQVPLDAPGSGNLTLFPTEAGVLVLAAPGVSLFAP